MIITKRIHKEKDYTPQAAQNEYIEILVKAGRRCAYDLRHAADFISGHTEFQRAMYDRAAHWQKVFNPADDIKNYRHHLHFVIDDLEMQVAKLIKRCEENNIDVSDITDSDIPF